MKSMVSLRNVVVSLGENECPTAFVIVPPPSLREELEDAVSVAIDDAKTAALVGVVKSDRAFVRGSVRAAAAGKRVFGALSGAWASLTQAADNVKDPKKVRAMLNGAVGRAFANREFEMFLLCERCMLPQPPEKSRAVKLAEQEEARRLGRDPEEVGDYDDRFSPWPLAIEQPSELVPKVMPMARRCLKAAAVVNGIGKMGRLFGLPTPVIPEAWMEQARAAVGDIADKADGSVADFTCMDAVFQGDAGTTDGETGETTQSAQVGHCLREFKRFLKEKDPDSKWCDLSRVLLPGQDEAAWVCPGCATALREGGGGAADPLKEPPAPPSAKQQRRESSGATGGGGGGTGGGGCGEESSTGGGPGAQAGASLRGRGRDYLVPDSAAQAAASPSGRSTVEDEVAELRAKMEIMKTENELATAEMLAKIEALSADVDEGFKIQHSSVCVIS